MKDEVISAFAFKVGKELERLVEEQNKNLLSQLYSMQESAFRFRKELEKSNNKNMLKLFDMYFNITEVI